MWNVDKTKYWLIWNDKTKYEAIQKMLQKMENNSQQKNIIV